MRKRMKGLLWGCVTFVCFALGLQFVTRLVDPRTGYEKRKEFVEEGDTYDVLFFGNSHMANAVYPQELWNDYGIASYNLAGFGIPLPVTWWLMQDALDYAQPKMVVVDCYSIGLEGKAGSKGMMHASLDPIPLSARKIRMIQDLIEDPKDRLEFYWDFAIYHDRWWDLDQADFEKSEYCEKGAQIAVDVVAPQEMSPKPDKCMEEETVGTAYLRQIIEECQSRRIELLLTYLPFPATEEGWMEALRMERIAKEYEVPCVNFLDLQVVDLEVDCSDKNSHLNGSGGRKVTAYLGQYIEQHYDIADHRGEEAYRGWDEDYRRYMDYKLEVTGRLETLDKYLMMLTDPAFDCCIYINGKADVWQEREMYMPLVDNLSGKMTEKLEEAVASGADYFLVVDHKKGQIYECVGEEALQAECSFGKVRYENGENGAKSLFIQDGEENYLHVTPQGSEVAVQVVVIDRENGDIVNVKRFADKLAIYAE